MHKLAKEVRRVRGPPLLLVLHMARESCLAGCLESGLRGGEPPARQKGWHGCRAMQLVFEAAAGSCTAADGLRHNFGHWHSD